MLVKSLSNVSRCWSAMETPVWNIQDPRVKVFRDDQTLLLKPQDVTVARLARVFKVKRKAVVVETMRKCILMFKIRSLLFHNDSLSRKSSFWRRM